MHRSSWKINKKVAVHDSSTPSFPVELTLALLTAKFRLSRRRRRRWKRSSFERRKWCQFHCPPALKDRIREGTISRIVGTVYFFRKKNCLLPVSLSQQPWEEEGGGKAIKQEKREASLNFCTIGRRLLLLTGQAFISPWNEEEALLFFFSLFIATKLAIEKMATNF